MKNILFITFFALSAFGEVSQEIFMETDTWKQITNCGEPIEAAQQRIEKSAQNKCSGELKRITEWTSVLKQPLHSFCYPKIVAAVFECIVQK